MRRGSSSLRKVRFGRPGERVVRGEVLQRQLMFLRAPLGFATVRDVLQQHGVHPARCPDRDRDRELHVAAFVVAADDLRGAALGGLVACIAGGQRNGRVEDRRDIASPQFVERGADQPLRLRIRVQHAPRSRVEQDDAGSGAIEDRAVTGFAGRGGYRRALQPAAVGVPGRDHDADQQRDPADQVTHALLTALHDRARQRGVQHRQRMIVDRVEAQLAFDRRCLSGARCGGHRVPPATRSFRRRRLVVQHREFHIELGVGADAGDFGRARCAARKPACRRRGRCDRCAARCAPR